ncbi:Uncharacterised protein [Bordetella ansorpii]|uniref:Lipoprotein n=1 Tax=Bordetella ansorpii TaxID=288768 RepID=A0A157PUG1_9BORD|nr:hypothetical protein [Bordetella ansorpii]SAI37252.1 Uncharacterised protein [Bordetella ansorpii]SAI66882.1 Uncharacterised protein [Bordetella ansorpii]
MIHNKRQFFISGGALLLLIACVWIASHFFGEQSKPPLASAQGELSCGSDQYSEYTKNMVLAGELTIGRQPPFGTRQQQQALVNAFEALDPQKDKTIISAGHLETGKFYTTVCKNEKCTMKEMADPEQVCLSENWSGCRYVAMQFREKKYCFMTPADQ